MKVFATRRGYTIVELIMSLAVLAIGATGIIAMQKVTLSSNQHAKNLAVATRIAEAWADALAADASLWNSSSDLSTETNWLKNTPTSGWTRPAWISNRSFGPGFSALGDPVQNTALATYCTDLKLAWLHAANPPGSGLIRAEIRVFWKRNGAITAETLPADFCAAANAPNDVTDNADGYHFVSLTTAVSQQVSP